MTELDRTKSYLPLGVSSLFRYCVEKLGLSESETMRFTQVARKCLEAPVLRDAINQGLLTVSKASRIAPVMTKENGDSWIQKAMSLKYREIEREVAKLNPKAIRRDTIKIQTVDRSELRVGISKELELKIRRAQEVMGARNLENLMERVFDFVLKHKDPMAKAVRDLRKQTKKSGANVPQSATWQTDKNGALVVPVLEKRLSVRPAIKAKLNHALYLRDQGGCAFKGCGEKKWLHRHHIQPVAMGGRNDLDNLLLVCSGHHRLVHGMGHRAR